MVQDNDTNTSNTARTIVVSDVHGFPELITRALDHAGFRFGVDRLILAGDWLDRGSEPAECLALLEDNAAEILVGNHDYAVAVGLRIVDQDPENLRTFRDYIAERICTRDWKAAASADGWLVTHAGVSPEWAARLDFGKDASAAADKVNEAFSDAVNALFDGVPYSSDSILGGKGPIRYRPRHINVHGFYDGLPQVVGHNPPGAIRHPELDHVRFSSPEVYHYHAYRRPPAGFFRYVVIENGEAREVCGQ